MLEAKDTERRRDAYTLEVPDPPVLEPFYLRVADLRQYAYCARLLYFFHCLPDVRPTTYKMEEGTEQHLEEREREKRRGLGMYGLKEAEGKAEKRFDVVVESTRLGLRGRLDMAIFVQDGGRRSAYPVEFKATRREPGPQYRLQLAAYALLLEEQEDVEARSGFYLLVPLQKVIPVRLDRGVKEKVERTVAEMHGVVRGETVPPASGRRGLCSVCEFRRFCNDVI